MPDMAGGLADRNGLALGGVERFEQAQIHGRGALRIDGEIDTGAVPGSSLWVRSSRKNGPRHSASLQNRNRFRCEMNVCFRNPARSVRRQTQPRGEWKR